MKKQKRLTAAQFREIHDLYWDDNVDQYTLANLYGVDQGHISHIVNNVRSPYQQALFIKKLKYEPNYIPSDNEPKQATSLRTKRTKLWNTKLTLTKANKIRKIWFSGEQTQAQLSKKYGVNQSIICRTVKGEKWKFEKKAKK